MWYYKMLVFVQKFGSFNFGELIIDLLSICEDDFDDGYERVSQHFLDLSKANPSYLSCDSNKGAKLQQSWRRAALNTPDWFLEANYPSNNSVLIWVTKSQIILSFVLFLKIFKVANYIVPYFGDMKELKGSFFHRPSIKHKLCHSDLFSLTDIKTK